VRYDLSLIETYLRIDELFRKIDAIEKTPVKGCRIFDKNAPYNRYPTITINRVIYRVGKLVLERKLGRSLLPNMLTLHNCDHPRCVEENHLYEGTHSNNSDDVLVSKGQLSTQNQTDGRTRLNLDNSATVDLFGTKNKYEEFVKETDQIEYQFHKDDCVVIISGSLNGTRAKITENVPASFKQTSRIQVMLIQTRSIHWVKISYLERM
jgi:hypothetical protein